MTSRKCLIMKGSDVTGQECLSCNKTMQPENLNAMMNIRAHLNKLYTLKEIESEEPLISGNKSLDSIKIVASTASRRHISSVYVPSENDQDVVMASKNLNEPLPILDLQPPSHDELDSKPMPSKSSKTHKKKKKSLKSSTDGKIQSSFENNHSTLSHHLRSTMKQGDISEQLYRSRSTQNLPSEIKQVKQVKFTVSQPSFQPQPTMHPEKLAPKNLNFQHFHFQATSPGKTAREFDSANYFKHIPFKKKFSRTR